MLTFRNWHNWEHQGAPKAALKTAVSVLKPGDLLGVADPKHAMLHPPHTGSKVDHIRMPETGESDRMRLACVRSPRQIVRRDRALHTGSSVRAGEPWLQDRDPDLSLFSITTALSPRFLKGALCVSKGRVRRRGVSLLNVFG